MLQKLILILAVFLVVLAALTFGEHAARGAFEWLSYLTGMAIHNFTDLYHALRDYVMRQPTKVIAALALTVPISIWLLRRQEQSTTRPANHRKVAIVLAVFLGWLGAHRFYVGQIGMGLLFLLICYFFTPLAFLLGLVDALRYAFTDDADMPGAPRSLREAPPLEGPPPHSGPPSA